MILYVISQLREERQRRCSALSLTKAKGKEAASSTGKGEFDDLISALRTGDVFGEDMAKLNKVRNRRRPSSPARITTATKLAREASGPASGVCRERLGPQFS